MGVKCSIIRMEQLTVHPICFHRDQSLQCVSPSNSSNSHFLTLLNRLWIEVVLLPQLSVTSLEFLIRPILGVGTSSKVSCNSGRKTYCIIICSPFWELVQAAKFLILQQWQENLLHYNLLSVLGVGTISKVSYITIVVGKPIAS